MYIYAYTYMTFIHSECLTWHRDITKDKNIMYSDPGLRTDC